VIKITSLFDLFYICVQVECSGVGDQRKYSDEIFQRIFW
jgi:hypothetical protein